ncbi:hypothetical protein Agub_g6822 [Astrephomene gubernaculifera]|uniref:Uncharacterized protein n=1 Tax=Astrephomene gubernaculifera TaxID=47775 RepID=A0AAD3DP62_9CHLO|nr:hypothetical protein Agub_g6822 [Astrephomene gubernaculifera]
MVTNPPYSGDHKERALEICLRSQRPWALLLPNYVATKAYFSELLTATATPASQRPFFLTPRVRYSYDHPEGTGHAESPFFSIWYVGLGPLTEAVYGACRTRLAGAGAAPEAGAGVAASAGAGDKASKQPGSGKQLPGSDGKQGAGAAGGPKARGAGEGAGSSSAAASAAGAASWDVSLARSVDALKQAGAVPTARRLNPKQRLRLKQQRQQQGQAGGKGKS